METTLRKLQLTQLEILKVFDQFCKRNDLKYSLYAGSLLGAVRHKGFIPWDDDLDVCMARSDYERFLTLWEANPTNGYILQNKENSKYFDQSFTKIRKDHTTFLQDEWEIGNHHTGIFLDVFPIDRIPKTNIARLVFKWNCMKYQLLTREFIPKKSNILVKVGSALILFFTPKSKRMDTRSKLLKKITKYGDDISLQTISIETMSTIQLPLSVDLLENYITLPFEDGNFMCFARWDDYLKRTYNDYMQYPPEEDRSWKHHPIIIDFDHNYDELSR